MRKKIRTVFFVMLVYASITGCKEKTTTPPPAEQQVAVVTEEEQWEQALKEEAASVPQVPLNQQVDMLLDSANATWNELKAADEEKLANIEKVANRVAKMKKHNPALLDSVRMLHKQAISKRFDRTTVSEANRIDEYDAVVTTLISSVTRLVDTTPNAEKCKECNDLIADIQKADQQDLIRRIRYDRHVKALNEILGTQQDKVKALGEKYQQLKIAPTFSK